jgi:FixJ family two-component response regulator
MRLSDLFDDPEVRAAVSRAEQDARERYNRLTPQQKVILPLLTDGLLNKEVAHELGISQRTVENHRAGIMERTECKSVSELTRLLMLAG